MGRISILAQAMRKVEPESNFKHHLDWYLKQGFTVIPIIPGTKKPALDEWAPYQKRSPTKREIEKWFYKAGKFNIGIICGETSGNLVVLDFEDAKIAYKIFGKGITKETLCVKSGKTQEETTAELEMYVPEVEEIEGWGHAFSGGEQDAYIHR